METDRIILRPWCEADAPALFKYASDPEVGSRAGWPPHKSVEESLDVIRTLFHNDSTWAIVLKETGEAVGAMAWVGRIPWRRKWQPAPVLLPGKSHEWRILVANIQSMGLQRLGHV